MKIKPIIIVNLKVKISSKFTERFLMKRGLLYSLIVTLQVLLSTYNYSQQTFTPEQIYKIVEHSIVVVNGYDSNNILLKQGSGVIIDENGRIVTNYHVLSGCDNIKVKIGRDIISQADIIGADIEKDVLVIKVSGEKLSPIKIGNDKSLNVGQIVYAIGNPMGLENTISEGIISGLRSYNENRNLIQITASISEGSSGGAVVNEEAELIGMSTATIKEGQNLNFAIPIDDILQVINQSSSPNQEDSDFNWFDKGNEASDMERYDEAIQYYSLYIKKHTEDANAYYNRGLAKISIEDYKGAIQDFNRAIEYDPRQADTYLSRGVVKSILGDLRGAIKDYTISIEIDPDQTSAYNNRGLAKSDLKDYKGALEDYNKVIEINPFDENSYNNRGLLKSDLGDYEGAIKDYTEVIKINPKSKVAYNNRALAKIKIEDIDGACEDWSKAGELGDERAYDFIQTYCR